jgi:dihydrofolate synthase/folylpolyglutamate synthase
MSVGLAIVDEASALRFLLERINYERISQIPYRTAEFRLDRMRELVERLGSPHLKVPAVHVAGTKGKGSTATMIATVLQRTGYRTGLYTSPHLERIEERFVVDGKPCTVEEFVALAQFVEPHVRAMDDAAEALDTRGPTFFEITTAMGMLHFVRRGVQLAVLEVGLGGRLDSTNVCQPEVCVITSISFDHTRQLGNTLAAIATEKAGIIKPGVPVVSGVVDPEPRDVIARIAAQQNAPLDQRQRDFDYQLRSSSLTGVCFDYLSATNGRSELFVPLAGEHQAANASTAIAAIDRLRQHGWTIPEAAIREGLAGLKWPARIEVLQERPLVVLDAAHNVASIAAVVETLRSVATRKRILIFAASKDKDAAGMLRLLLPAFDHVVLTRYVENPRARSIEELQAIAAEESRAGRPVSIHTANDPIAAWQVARQLAGDDDLICITGSFFLAAELRPLLTLRAKVES